MPIPVTSQVPPPQSWEEFESMCADLYTRIWGDDDTQKHGRQGQPQGGVDVYGRPDGKYYSGVQCKKKSIWPPMDLTITDIDEEVEKAKTWKPGITKYIIATTAPNDEKAQAHARALTQAHEKKGLFSVTVISWDEITRRLTSYPDLLKKYYPNIAIADVVQELTASIPAMTAKLVAELTAAAAPLVQIGLAEISRNLVASTTLAEEVSSYGHLVKRFVRFYGGNSEHPKPFAGRDLELKMLDDWLAHSSSDPNLLLTACGKNSSIDFAPGRLVQSVNN